MPARQPQECHTEWLKAVNAGDLEYIVCLVARVVTVSLHTQRLVASLPPLEFEAPAEA